METIAKGRIRLVQTFFFVGLTNTLLFISPAFWVSCNMNEETRIESNDEEYESHETLKAIPINVERDCEALCLDLFFFRKKQSGGLEEGLYEGNIDAYQRIAPLPQDVSQITGASSTSADRLVAVANSSTERRDWNHINTYGILSTLRSDIRDEDPVYPLMSGEASLEPGTYRSCEICLEPLLSIIEVHSLCCDFSMRPYRDSKLENVRIYLTNVSGNCSLLGGSSCSTEYILNAGGCSESDINSLTHPEMLCTILNTPVGNNVLTDVVQLYCYPNTNAEETAGTPFTRLVIEGEIDGEKYYYPFDINRADGGQGIERNMRYSFDITLTRRGVKDPDEPIRTDAATFRLSISPWKHKEPRTIDY